MSGEGFPAIIKNLTRLTPEQERERLTWQYRAIEMVRGSQTQIGCVLLAVLQRSSQHSPPRYGHGAWISANGIVVTVFQDAGGKMHPVRAVEHIDVIRDAFRNLADRLKLPDVEREEMMGELRKWITRDLRTTAPKLTEN